MTNPSRDERHFRRGVVLGLTMAEILLLLLFLLMLLLAVEISKQKRLSAALTLERDAAISELAALKPLLDEMKAGNKSSFDITKEYVRAKKALAEAERKLKQNEVALTLLSEAESSDTSDASIEEKVERFVERAKIGTSIQEAGGDQQKLVQDAAMCQANLKSCKGQTVFLNNKLNDKNGGRDFPPCWADENGKIQYIYNATLTDNGIVVTDNRVKGREADQAALPLQRVKLDQPVDVSSFRYAMQPILDWSNEHQCRHYVRLIDGFAEGGRAQYKELRRTVEGYFYILDQK